MLLARLGSGAFFGEINLFDPGLATASIYAMKTTRLAIIPYDLFRNYMETNPTAGYKIASGLMTEMSRRLRATSARLVNSVFWSDKAGT
jgi:CRP-like cAMP-binding protein